MKKVEAFKDGKGNIVITEDSFEMVLACLDNQKFVGEGPCNGDSLSIGKEEYYKTQQNIQDTIDKYNRECRKILHQKLVFELKEDDYYLTKRYEFQDKIIGWSWVDALKIRDSVFKDSVINKEFKIPENLKPITKDTPIMKGTEPLGINEEGFVVCKPDPQPWLIERNVFTDEGHLTISEDGKNNRPWKKSEVEQIKNLFIKN